MRTRRIVTAVALASALALAATSPASAATQRGARSGPVDIVGGETAATNYPYAAAILGSGGGQYCSGSLIAPQWVITAGHCLSGTSRVRVGSNDYTSGGKLVRVTEKVKGKKDIGLLKLAEPVSYTPIQIAPSSPAMGAKIRLMGWGVTCDRGCGSPRLLKQLDTTVIADSKCSRDDIDGPTEVCVKVTVSQTACYGDSGGPAVVDGMLVGADDRGGNVCGDTGGEIYKDVTAYRDWIREHAGV